LRVSEHIGRFAPSPSGPLHAGSLVAALASWLDARAHGGTWLVRIEDVDGPRTAAGAEEQILRQLHALGLVPDAPPVRQSERSALYEPALQRLRDAGGAYPCGCTRREIEGELAAWRLRCGDGAHITWRDRRLGDQQQDVAHAVGDFVLQRADGPWAYQLAVVVDDAEQGITHVVRGEDLADNTARQIHLQRLLGLPTPRYLHTPLVRDARGDKLSKSNGAAPLDVSDPWAALHAAAEVLGLPASDATTSSDALHHMVTAWGQRWPL
jgi:glutamyl-Q tRNA(Asp) synthetase